MYKLLGSEPKSSILEIKSLEEKLKEKGIRERVRIPEDGESYRI